MSGRVLVERVPLHASLRDRFLDGLNAGTGLVQVPVYLDPTLPVRGKTETGYSGERYIVLREHNGQVLLHELLHVLVDRVTPGHVHGEHNHALISELEVGLWTAGYRRERRAS